MSKATLNYTEKHHVLVVDGVEYEIPQRTAELEERLKEHDEKVKDMTEYDGNMEMLGILFGEDNAKQMFPDKKTTNLNKLAECTRMAVAFYLADSILIKDKSLKDKLIEMGFEA